MNTFRALKLTTATVALGALALATPVSAAPRVANAMAPIHSMGLFNRSSGNGNGSGHHGGGGGSANLSYHGGTVQGVGVETAPKVYLVLWGSQWTTSGGDPYGEATILQNFLSAVGKSNWNNTVTQYCESVASGTVTCPSGGTAVGNQSNMFAGTLKDEGSAAPRRASQAQLAAEAIKAANQLGNSPNTQFVIATASGDNPSGFGSSYCAWHSSTTSSVGNIAYTNLPYMTDAGAACGSTLGLGVTAGITIVEGHEFAETETDPFPSTGWLDGSGSEIGDKCAWDPTTSVQQFPNGSQFPVQPLWSNAASNGSGGCALSFP